MERIDCVVIGAGIIGLAAAQALARDGCEVIVLERQRHIGSGISSRNSEVIHAGIYYPAESLKARFCVEGRDQLYAHCEAFAVAHRKCGKLIVATQPQQIAELERLQQAAVRNGVHDLVLLDAADARRLEPALHCVAALLSPSTGIIDSHGLMLSLQGDAEAHGASIAFDADVAKLDCDDDNGVKITLAGEDTPSLAARLVVNAAGLHAPDIASRTYGGGAAPARRAYYAKGSYFALSGKAPFSRLIYPVPEPGGLGVHLTLDLGGQARFGPDVEWIDTPHYDVDPKRGEKFYAAVRAYWPGLRDGALEPAYAGVRPKLSGPGAPAEDFVIEGPSQHGAKGVIHLLGIESPGLTSSLAIGGHVAALARESLDA